MTKREQNPFFFAHFRFARIVDESVSCSNNHYFSFWDDEHLTPVQAGPECDRIVQPEFISLENDV